MAGDGIVDKLNKLIDLGRDLSSETNHELLLEKILLGAKSLANADGGTLYLSVDDADFGHSVRMEIIRTDSLNFEMGGSSPTRVPFPPIPLYSRDGEPNERNVVTYAVLKHCTVNIEDAYVTDKGFDFSGTRRFDSETGYRSTSMLCIPLRNHMGEIVGALQLLNALDDHGKAIPFSAEVQRLVEALASQAAVVLTQKQLISNLEDLFQAFIRLIANAIDEKSPYTGGHCRRVPIITMLLAEAAHRTQQGPLSHFTLSDADRYELEIAAWLHDCGKVTTPEYVVDKATKLETIFDRIQLVETRCEVLKRDMRIEMLNQRLAALEEGRQVDAAALEAKYQDQIQRLENDLAFLRQCNKGGEFLEPTDQKRILAIARQTWVVDGETRPLLTSDEVYNLSISRGTLTPEERDKINDHVSATIKMLEALPFPKHMRRVPEFAGGHHERMDGQGYPRGLTGQQMSLQARILAIADVFEALTAGDRPYKPGKTLSEALRILAFMARDGHIDPDLYRLFVTEKVYEQYAQEHLTPDQIDEVDHGVLLKTATTAKAY